MAKQVWKFTLDPAEPKASLPTGARIIHAHEQHGAVCLWAVVNPDEDREVRRFTVYGTGHQMPDNPGTYIGTVHMFGGSLVFHVFEAASA